MRKQILFGFLFSLLVPLLAHAAEVKIGFLVKQYEEQWFQLEWKFAEEAAQEYGFTLFTIPTPDAKTTFAAIVHLASIGAQGFIICAPDVTLGPAIVAKAKANNLRLLAVDDRFVDYDGKEMVTVPYLGISAEKIGREVGKTLMTEARERGWNTGDIGFMVMDFNLTTIRERLGGATRQVMEMGFPENQIHYAEVADRMEVATARVAAAALLKKHPTIKHWLVAGGNDNCVLGAVRALEDAGIQAEDAIGVGINGTDCIEELTKKEPSSFYGSILLSAREHGYRTAVLMYERVMKGKMIPLDTRTMGKLITRDNFREILKKEGIVE